MKSFLKYILLTITLLTINSCVTRRACERKFPPQIRSDSIVVQQVKTVYKDTTIFIHIPGDTVFKTDTVFITKQGAQSAPIESDLKYSYAKAWVKNGRLNLLHQTKDTIIQAIIENAIRESEKTQTTTINKETIKEVPFIPWWAKILIWLSIPTILWLLFQAFKILSKLLI